MTTMIIHNIPSIIHVCLKEALYNELMTIPDTLQHIHTRTVLYCQRRSWICCCTWKRNTLQLNRRTNTPSLAVQPVLPHPILCYPLVSYPVPPWPLILCVSDDCVLAVPLAHLSLSLSFCACEPIIVNPPTLANLGDGAETRELQCQHEGGSCEFFLLCWMSSGLIQGTCGGFMRGCCHRTAKSANLGSSESNTVDLTSVKPKDYGPVINDPSECHPQHDSCAFSLLIICYYITSPTCVLSCVVVIVVSLSRLQLWKIYQRTASFPPSS